jgi:ABC-type transporter MlaC component
MIKTRILFSLLAALLMAAVMSIAQPRHPNLMAAQQLCNQAFEKISAAQAANEWDMHGHAQKAKNLLEQAKAELREATMAANHK